MPTLNKTRLSYIPKRKDLRKHKDRKEYAKEYAKGYWKRTSSNIQDRDNAICQVCGKADVVGRLGNCDHIIPLNQRGSKTDWANLWWLCLSCHGKKTTRLDGYGYTGDVNEAMERIATKETKERIKKQLNKY